MSDLTPAAELRAAAEKLRALATAASTDESGHPTARWAVRYQQGVTPGAPPQTDRSCYLDALDETNTDGRGARPLLHGGGGGTRPRPPSVAPQHSRYIAAMDPSVGAALADWLDAEADGPLADLHSDRCMERGCTINAALTVARQILGETTS